MAVTAIIGLLSGLTVGGFKAEEAGSGAKWKYLLLYGTLGFVAGLAVGFITAVIGATSLSMLAQIGVAAVLSWFVLIVVNLAAFAIQNGRGPDMDEILDLVVMSLLPAVFLGVGVLSIGVTALMTFFGLFFDMILVPVLDDAADQPNRDVRLEKELREAGLDDI